MNHELTVLLQAIQEAGEAIVALQKTDISITKKANNDIVTKADLLANDILKKYLLAAFPQYGWLSEESVDDLSRLTSNRTWIVDPIDGTREYARGIKEYAISVALVEKGIPILSAVFNPATNELFHAVKHQGAWLNNQKITCDHTNSENLLLLASRSEYERGDWKKYETTHRVEQVGSIAYKLALIAAGRAHATFSLGPKSEWDIAGGVLLVQEAGGIVTDKNKQAFLFNAKQVLVEGVVASTAKHSEQVFYLINN